MTPNDPLRATETAQRAENDQPDAPDTAQAHTEAQIEYLQAVVDFHEPGPSTTGKCYWCGKPSPCEPYTRAKAELAKETRCNSSR